MSLARLIEFEPYARSVCQKPLRTGHSHLSNMIQSTHTSLTNHILAALSPEDRGSLIFGAERVQLSTRKILFDEGEEIRHAYFPLSGMCSLLSINADGRSVEVAVVGSEGMLGLPATLRAAKAPYQVIVQLSGEAIKVSAYRLRSEFDRCGRLKDLLLRHAFALLTQLTQSVACHRFHTAEERLARWLLLARIRARSDSFHVTQEVLSYMLGTPRTRITTLASAMQQAGLIRYSRGTITILDVDGLKSASCECYHIVMEEAERLMAA